MWLVSIVTHGQLSSPQGPNTIFAVVLVRKWSIGVGPASYHHMLHSNSTVSIENSQDGESWTLSTQINESMFIQVWGIISFKGSGNYRLGVPVEKCKHVHKIMVRLNSHKLLLVKRQWSPRTSQKQINDSYISPYITYPSINIDPYYMSYK